MAAKYLKQIHEITKEAGKEEPALAVKMVGYEARMRLGSKKWISLVQPSSSKAIIDVAKQAIADLQGSAAAIQRSQVPVQEVRQNPMKRENQ